MVETAVDDLRRGIDGWNAAVGFDGRGWGYGGPLRALDDAVDALVAVGLRGSVLRHLL